MLLFGNIILTQFFAAIILTLVTLILNATVERGWKNVVGIVCAIMWISAFLEGITYLIIKLWTTTT